MARVAPEQHEMKLCPEQSELKPQPKITWNFDFTNTLLSNVNTNFLVTTSTTPIISYYLLHEYSY